MTRQEAKSKASIRIQFFDAKGANKVIDQIFNDHETAIEILMKANEEEISRHFNECEKYEAQIKALQQPKSCDDCKNRIFYTYDSFKQVTIDKCNIREKLHFNGSCDGLCCDKYESKEQ